MLQVFGVDFIDFIEFFELIGFLEFLVFQVNPFASLDQKKSYTNWIHDSPSIVMDEAK